jgi:glycosylphosphatidylinositol transamidase (GPIT) subunit GPI8
MKENIEIELEVETEKVNGIESLTGAINLHVDTTPENILSEDILFRVTDIKKDGSKFKVKLSKAQHIVTATHYMKDNSVYQLVVKGGKVVIK